jgi:hypothetical protein
MYYYWVKIKVLFDCYCQDIENISKRVEILKSLHNGAKGREIFPLHAFMVKSKWESVNREANPVKPNLALKLGIN